MREYRQLADKPARRRADGDADAAITGAARKISATYEFRISRTRRWSRSTRSSS